MSNPMDRDIDFGDDDDVPMPDDPHFDAWIASVAPSVNAPSPTPRAEMWEAIQAAGKSTMPPANQVTPVTPLRRRQWYVPAAIAAALLLGISIDRYLLDGRGTPPAAPPAQVATAPATTAPHDSDPSKLYRLAAVQTLTQAEALLTAYRAGNVANVNPAAARQLGTWGRDVLSSTRLLLDSPAGDDPQFRTLLDDLELVLVQIIRLSGAPLDSSDRRLIEDVMRDRDLLPRIRTAVPAGDASTASDD